MLPGVLLLLAVGCGGGEGPPGTSPSDGGTQPGAGPPSGAPAAPRVLSEQETQILRQSVEAGTAALNARRYAEAALELSKAVGVQPDNPRLLRMLGNAHAHNNDPVLARRALEASIQLDPTVPGTHFELAQVALVLGELDLALQESRRTVALDPDSLRAKELLGVVLYSRDDVEQATEVLEPVVSADSSRLDALHTLGLCFQAAERYEEARDTFRAVVERQPAHAEAWLHLGEVLASLGDEAGAAEATATYQRLSPGGSPPSGPDGNAVTPPGAGEPGT